MKLDGVFSGGGVKGIGLVGSVCCMEEKGASWQRIAGTSAGAIIASLIAVGFTGKEMKEILFNLNFLDFAYKDVYDYIPIAGKPAELFMTKGLYSSEPIEDYLNSLYAKKGKYLFRDISPNGISPLKIIASDITNRKALILPDDIKQYGIEPMDFQIAKAVRMSLNVPILFKPIVLKYCGMDAYIVDGGIMSNFPIWMFDVKGIPQWPTMGFKFKSPKSIVNPNNENRFFHYIKDLLGSILDTYDDIVLRDCDTVRTIDINTNNIKSLNFKISKAEKLQLFKCGYDAASEFLNKWDFKDYITKYRT